MNIDFKVVSERAAYLDRVRAILKVEFFGIDPVIDRIIESVKTWYLLPEIVTRPVIINLFGLTGVGKTALVRSLVKHLGFQNQFVEIQMDGLSNESSSSNTSICDILQESSIGEGKPGIILLDEFQRYRTIDAMGNDVKVERYADVWMLLSDGCFPSDHKALARLERKLAYYDYFDDQDAARNAEMAAAAEPGNDGDYTYDPDTLSVYNKGVLTEYTLRQVKAWGQRCLPKRHLKTALTYKRRYYLDYSDAEEIKDIIRVHETTRQIMEWPKEKAQQIVRAAVEAQANPPIDYTKCLIFIGGNLDEAFNMANEIEDCDTNADVYHEYTKKVGSIEIKKALSQRFKPEQIARLGNNHIVYPSLGAAAYLSIIKRACQSYLDEAFKLCGITFTIKDDVYQEIYDNSVYPTQGTRPVFTSVHKMFGYPLSDAILWGLSLDAREIIIDLDIPSSSIVFMYGELRNAVRIDLEMRARRTKHSRDFNALVAVHEAGHALVYAELFKMPPVEIAISVASFKGGYNRFAGEHLSKDETLDRIATGMGGIVAEELLFGQELRSTGCSSDIEKATELAGRFVRKYAMDGFNSHIDNPSQTEVMYNTNLEASSVSIEQIMTDMKARAQTILVKHRDLLVTLSRNLLIVKKMDAAAFYEYARGQIEGLMPLVDRDVNGDYATRLERA